MEESDLDISANGTDDSPGMYDDHDIELDTEHDEWSSGEDYSDHDGDESGENDDFSDQQDDSSNSNEQSDQNDESGQGDEDSENSDENGQEDADNADELDMLEQDEETDHQDDDFDQEDEQSAEEETVNELDLDDEEEQESESFDQETDHSVQEAGSLVEEQVQVDSSSSNAETFEDLSNTSHHTAVLEQEETDHSDDDFDQEDEYTVGEESNERSYPDDELDDEEEQESESFDQETDHPVQEAGSLVEEQVSFTQEVGGLLTEEEKAMQATLLQHFHEAMERKKATAAAQAMSSTSDLVSSSSGAQALPFSTRDLTSTTNSATAKSRDAAITGASEPDKRKRRSTQNETENNVNTLCMLCDEEHALIIFRPCNHQVCCLECSIRLKKCIRCNNKIEWKAKPDGVKIDVPNKAEGYLDLINKVNAQEEAQNCVICMENKKRIVFGCGHLACENCARRINKCHICQKNITIRTKIYEF